MIEQLAFITIVVTQGTADTPAGTQFKSTEPIACITGTDEGIAKIEAMGGKADAYCAYTYAPVRSLRPKARVQVNQP